MLASLKEPGIEGVMPTEDALHAGDVLICVNC